MAKMTKARGFVGLSRFFAPRKNNVAKPPGERAWKKWFEETPGRFAWLRWFAVKVGIKKPSSQAPLDNSGIPVG